MINVNRESFSLSISMEGYPPGIYLLRLIGEQWSKTNKIIKQQFFFQEQ
jgi:hypothetical protein